MLSADSFISHHEVQAADENYAQILPFAFYDFPDAEFYLPHPPNYQQQYFPLNEQELNLYDNLGIFLELFKSKFIHL